MKILRYINVFDICDNIHTTFIGNIEFLQLWKMQAILSLNRKIWNINFTINTICIDGGVMGVSLVCKTFFSLFKLILL